MSSEVAKLIQPDILRLLEAGELDELRAECEEIHPADIEDIIVDLPEEQRGSFFEALSLHKQVETFSFMDPVFAAGVLDQISSAARRKLLNGLSPDDRVEFLTGLGDDERAEDYIAHLNTQERLYTEALLRGEEGTAGRMMTPKFLSVSSSDTVDEAFRHIRSSAKFAETIYVAYIVDEGGKLIGTISLRDLLAARPTDIVDDVMTGDPVSVTVDTWQEDVANLAQKYDLLAVPVVTPDGRLAGIVTYDDLHDVTAEEASEDILRMHGVATATESYFEASILTKYRQRLIVLASLVGVSIMSVLLQEHFNYVINKISILAIYLTMLAGSCGNCGTQIAGIVIRAQALHDIDRDTFRRLILREMVVGLMMAVTLSMAVGAMVFIQSPGVVSRGDSSIGLIAVTVSLAMFVALTTVNLLGGVIPVLMKRLGLDPALTAGPFITTAADILTVLVYFGTASWLLL